MKKKQLTQLKVKEVSLVDLGANGEEFQVFKSASGEPGETDEGDSPGESGDESESGESGEESDMDPKMLEAMEAAVSKAVTDSVASLLESTVAKAVEATQAAMATQVQTAISEGTVEITKAFDLHKQLVDEKVSGIQSAVAAFGDQIKSGMDYDTLWSHCMHIKDALNALKEDSFTLQTQTVGVAKSADGAEQKPDVAAFLDAVAADVNAISVAKSAATKNAVELNLADIGEKVAKMADSIAEIKTEVGLLTSAPEVSGAPADSKVEKSKNQAGWGSVLGLPSTGK